jgi:hypothetical protein
MKLQTVDEYMRTPDAFMAAVRGIPTHHVTRALNSLTPGIDWRGTTKGRMAEAYGDANTPGTRYSYYQLRGLNLAVLRLRALQRAASNPNTASALRLPFGIAAANTPMPLTKWLPFWPSRKPALRR